MSTQVPPSLERENLALDRYKAKLDFWKFVLGSVFAALAIAAIPPSFQLATAVLEQKKSEAQLRADQFNKTAERDAKAQEFRENNIKSFIAQAVDQDIELRMRFADYFASVSSEEYRRQWETYRDQLRNHRDDVRQQIDHLENNWSLEASMPQKDTEKIARIERNLAWLYKEVGYVERNRSVSINPRALAFSNNNESLKVIYKSQRQTTVSNATLSKFIPSPIRDDTISHMKPDDCVEPDNAEFIRKLKTGVMIAGQREVVMLREFWDKANADIIEMKNKLPDLSKNLYIANKPISICAIKSINREYLFSPLSYGIYLELYLDRADALGDVGSWTQKKVDDYRQLVDFMNSKGWQWFYTPSFDYSFNGTFYPSNALVFELLNRHRKAS